MTLKYDTTTTCDNMNGDEKFLFGDYERPYFSK
jgi:hypothetical protein